MAAEGGAGPRWLDYVLATGGDCDQLLSAAAGLGRLVLLYGDGFDPRSLQTVRRLAALDLPTVVVQIPLPQGDGRGATTELARRNREQLLDIANAGMEIVNLDPVLDADRLTVGSRISRNLIESGIVGEEDAVIVDASALPTRIFFP